MQRAIEQPDVNYARRAEEFFSEQLVDATVRPGGQGGAFCWYIHGSIVILLQSHTDKSYRSTNTLPYRDGLG
jgi:oligoendopeptidase F